jgi:hypothetical protein
MIHLKNNGKINFILDLHTTFGDALTGGLMSMHYLANQIAQKGHNVYMFCKPEYPHENIHTLNSVRTQINDLVTFQWEEFTFFLQNTVSIYPQITKGNPFNTKHVSRWILYDTEKETEETYGESDYYFNYGSFKTHKNTDNKLLTVNDFSFDKLINKKLDNRKGFCHILHKNNNQNSNILVEEIESKDIGDWKTKGGIDYLSEQFNKHEYFITYDEKSFFTVAAALCGCKSIICNPKNKSDIFEHNHNKNILTPLQYRMINPLQMFGVAYGFSDLSWAEKTIHLVREHLMNIEKINNNTVDNFIDFWNQKCYG